MYRSDLKTECNELVQSYPCKVSFVGFESDTYCLQKNGWEVSCRQTVYIHDANPSITLAFYHPKANLYALTTPIFIPYEYSCNGVFEFIKNMYFEITCVNSTYRIYEPMNQSVQFFNEFEPINCKPERVIVPDCRLSDFKIFKPVGNPKEIIIGPKNVQEALELVLKLQDPEQNRIFQEKRQEKARQDMRNEINKADYEVSAQIICLK